MVLKGIIVFPHFLKFYISYICPLLQDTHSIKQLHLTPNNESRYHLTGMHLNYMLFKIKVPTQV